MSRISRHRGVLENARRGIKLYSFLLGAFMIEMGKERRVCTKGRRLDGQDMGDAQPYVLFPS